MIKVVDKVFKLDSKKTSYIIRVSEFGHLFLDYYGAYIFDTDCFEFSKEKISFPGGTSTAYDDAKPNYSLDAYSLEISTPGKGDYKDSSLIIKDDEGYILDLIYDHYDIKKQFIPLQELPSPHGEAEELIIFTKDNHKKIEVELHYLVFVDSDVILRNIVIHNKNNKLIHIEKVLSMNLEMVGKDFTLISLYGGWGFEANKNEVKLDHGIYINDSKTGNSSNRHNPFFMLKEKESTQISGDVYAFNLIYSGNHIEEIEHSSFNKVRIQCGINPYCFSYALKENESFVTPYAVLTYSNKGTNGASQNMHDFIRQNIIPLSFKDKNAPIVINNWEATYMKFKESKLHSIIKNAKALGIELFVLDDGWFGRRTDDSKGLGDYDVNKNKLHFGLEGLSKYASKKGLSFGLWFEPEMVNEDSNLFETHPDWAITSSGYIPSKGRHQLVLDLTKKEVQDYIISSLHDVLSCAPINYVKWDMNRHMSDVCSRDYDAGEMYHRYMLGLYRILKEITTLHPNVYFEGCASGGNRFDLGILTYMPQIWTSDDTDAYERINIQSGYALAYPLRTLSNHVSASPSHQPLRNTPLDSRFNVAFFGAFGYELDLSYLTPVEKKMVEEQIKFYKEHRGLVMNGDFYQLKDVKKDGYAVWLIISKDRQEAVLGIFNSLQSMNPKIEDLRLPGFIPETMYDFSVRHQEINIQTFGGLINMILPIHVNERGFLVRTISKHKTMPGETEHYVLSGSALNNGALKLNQQWMGTGFDNHTRVLGDFGSRLYYVKAVK